MVRQPVDPQGLFVPSHSSPLRAIPSQRMSRVGLIAAFEVELHRCSSHLRSEPHRVTDFDLENGVWKLLPNRNKTKSFIEIPLPPEVIAWLQEFIVLACGSANLFPARRLVRARKGVPRKNRFPHLGPDTLNVALKRLPLEDIEHFTVHDMRRTARTHLATLGVDWFVAERALNHKLRGTERVYDQHDYFEQRKQALCRWAAMLGAVSRGEPVNPLKIRLQAEREASGRLANLAGRLPDSLVTRQAANEVSRSSKV